MNNDGQRKRTFDAPSIEGQKEAIAIALSDHEFGEPAPAVSYVECHGTATKLGDPIELAALQETHGKSGPLSAPLVVGSSKANIGHANTAAGALGFMKMVMQLHKKQIVPICHFSEKNPLIENLGNSRALVFPIKSEPWNVECSRRVGAVSSFGIGGTNVHLIMEEIEPSAAQMPPELLEHSAETVPSPVLLLSARSKSGLEEARAAFLQAIASGDLSMRSAAYTLQFARPHLPYRLGFSNLRQLADNKIQEAAGASSPARVVFMFPGQGSQHAEMGRFYLNSPSRWPVFHSTLSAIEAIARSVKSSEQEAGPVGLRKFLKNPKNVNNETTQLAIFSLEVSCLRPVADSLSYFLLFSHSLFPPPFLSRVDHTPFPTANANYVPFLHPRLIFLVSFSPPTLPFICPSLLILFLLFLTRACSKKIAPPFTFLSLAPQVCLGETMLQQFGLRPKCVIGHSLGEYAAAVVSSLLTLEEGTALVQYRGQLLDRETRSKPENVEDGDVGMMGVNCSWEELESSCSENNSGLLVGVELACHNAPRRIAVGGSHTKLLALKAFLEGKGVSASVLRVDTAFHTRAVDPLIGEMETKLRGLFATSKNIAHSGRHNIHMVSTCTGETVLPKAIRTTEYWLKHMRAPVRFVDAVRACCSSAKTSVEIERHPLNRLIFVEVGTMETLTKLSRMILKDSTTATDTRSIALLPHAKEAPDVHSTDNFFLNKLALLWGEGVHLDFHKDWKCAELKRFFPERIQSIHSAFWDRGEEVWPLASHVHGHTPAVRSNATDNRLVLLMEESRRRLVAPVVPHSDAHVFYDFKYSRDGACAEHLCRPQDEFDLHHCAQLQTSIISLDGGGLPGFSGPGWGHTTVCSSTMDWVEHGPRWVVVGRSNGNVASPQEQLQRLKKLVVYFQALQQEVTNREADDAELWFVFENGELDFAACVAFVRAARKETLGFPVFMVLLEDEHGMNHPALQHQLALEMVAKSDREVLLCVDKGLVSRALPQISPSTALNEAISLPVFNPETVCNQWVVITGGSSGVGLEIAKWCVFSGVGNILLLSRNEVSLGAVGRLIAESVDTWGTRGSSDGQLPAPNIVSLPLDISLEDGGPGICQAILKCGIAYTSVAGIFHCAGVVRYANDTGCKCCVLEGKMLKKGTVPRRSRRNDAMPRTDESEGRK
jgi:malonyl CoA-acyl carrier protein transacylase